MVALVYPSTLPCPQRSPYQRAERRALSTLPGQRRARALWRDRLGTEPVQFLLTFEEVAIWLDWFDNEQLHGGAWFAAPWRLPSGRDGVYRFIEPPGYPEFVAVVGWRVTAVLEVRGRGMVPQSHITPESASLFHHRFDRVGTTDWIDVEGLTWTESVVRPGGTLEQSVPSKFGAGAMHARNDTGSTPYIEASYANVPLDAGGLNRFTLRAWVRPGGFGVSYIGVNNSIRIEIQSAAAYSRGTFTTGLWDIGGTAISPSDFTLIEANYNGTHHRLFVNGVMVAKLAQAPGDPIEVITAHVGANSFSPGDEVRIDEAQCLIGYCWHPSDSSYTVPSGPF